MIPNPKLAHITDIYQDDFAFDVEVDAETRQVPLYCIWQDKLPVRLFRYAIQQPLWAWLRWFGRVNYYGLEHLPRKGPIILAANHRSHSDTGLILSALPFSVATRTAPAAAKDFWFKRRFKSTMVRLYFNALAVVRRGQGARSMVSEMVRYLCRGSGRALLIYPEGGRVDLHEGLSELKTGVSRISLISGAPIVPIAIHNSEYLLPKNAGLRRPSRSTPITVRFGEPIDPKKYEAQLRKHEVRAARDMTNELRDRISELLEIAASESVAAQAGLTAGRPSSSPNQPV